MIVRHNFEKAEITKTIGLYNKDTHTVTCMVKTKDDEVSLTVGMNFFQNKVKYDEWSKLSNPTFDKYKVQGLYDTSDSFGGILPKTRKDLMDFDTIEEAAEEAKSRSDCRDVIIMHEGHQVGHYFNFEGSYFEIN